ncbi:MAG: PH domain-containing protein [Candidatus Nomurabacteria bacterium]|jgi:hypothetical protein|nr:PH domain-containing protein [Candidatus Nomurabacteria bacterium]
MNDARDPGDDMIPDAYDSQGRPLFYRPPTLDEVENSRQNSLADQASSAENPRARGVKNPADNGEDFSDQVQTAAPILPGLESDQNLTAQNLQPATPSPKPDDPHLNAESNQVLSAGAAEELAMLHSVEQPGGDIPPEVAAKHNESKQKYPQLNLADDEYVILQLKRHPIGWLRIWLGAIGAGLVLMAAALFMAFTTVGAGRFGIFLAGLAMLVLAILFGGILAWTYRQNAFYITNQRVINFVRSSAFATRKQSISLERVEEASYSQSGPLQMALGYGTIRLATVGDETTYPFTYVANPADQLSAINQIIQEYDQAHGIEKTKG